MRAVALVLVVCVLAAGGVVVYAAVNTTLAYEVRQVQVVPASERPDEYVRWQTALLREAAQGTAFGGDFTGTAQDYTFFIYTVDVKNRGLIGARMAELQVGPVEGDVLAISPAASMHRNVNEPVDIPAGATRAIQCILLTRAGGNAVRDLYLTYYIWGTAHTIRLTYG